MKNSQISRRRFLKGLAAVPVGAALAGSISNVFAQTPAPSGPVTGTVSAVPLIIKAPPKTTKAISDIDICENMFVGHNS